ncbi:hypothetical protein Apa02nite_072960 [Actinoplanes palleronii]|uniref:VOC domain-containing protein n=1 Tax=Actinoplanes palleronii TaxID=113570 RepID=A0ABQ4BKL3_9ACTN|nr:hypothetical protein Apa02nite_072960 [Actinoplanes palleronii]
MRGVKLFAICIDAGDPGKLATFWAGVLGREVIDGAVLPAAADRGFRIRFAESRAPKVVQNRLHFDLTSTSLEDQQATADRAVQLGGRHIDVGQLPEEGHIVLADPDGNEFCVIEPGNNFTAGCGVIGTLSCDGTPEVGHFWSAALGWPLVWDQDEETAIQSPQGGPKISWGGPPYAPRNGRDRLRLDLVAAEGEDRQTEIDRLVGLGATIAGPDPSQAGRLLMTDPDGNEFSVA